MSTRKNFILNGYSYYTDHNLTLSDIINYFNNQLSLVVIEYNHKICDKQEWDKIFLKDADKVELITIVGGG
jgi:thiamine biosynthesis protein ThiS